MTQETVTFAGMHAEHRQWQSEHTMWDDDIELWREQYDCTFAQLKQLEELLLQYGEGLDAHAQSIERIGRSAEGHEKAMAAYLREGEDAEGQEAMCKNHRQKAERHAEQRVAHEQIKKRHHTVIAHLSMLKAAIESVA